MNDGILNSAWLIPNLHRLKDVFNTKNYSNGTFYETLSKLLLLMVANSTYIINWILFVCFVYQLVFIRKCLTVPYFKQRYVSISLIKCLVFCLLNTL